MSFLNYFKNPTLFAYLFAFSSRRRSKSLFPWKPDASSQKRFSRRQVWPWTRGSPPIQKNLPQFWSDLKRHRCLSNPLNCSRRVRFQANRQTWGSWGCWKKLLLDLYSTYSKEKNYYFILNKNYLSVFFAYKIEYRNGSRSLEKLPRESINTQNVRSSSARWISLNRIESIPLPVLLTSYGTKNSCSLYLTPFFFGTKILRWVTQE